MVRSLASQCLLTLSSSWITEEERRYLDMTTYYSDILRRIFHEIYGVQRGQDLPKKGVDLLQLFTKCTPVSGSEVLSNLVKKPIKEKEYPPRLVLDGPYAFSSEEIATVSFINGGLKGDAKKLNWAFIRDLLFGKNVDWAFIRDLLFGKNVDEIRKEHDLSNVNLSVYILPIARFGRPYILRTLIELGANLDAQDENGKTPAHVAAETGNLEALRMLKELGANLEVGDFGRKTPAHIAAETGNLEALKVLKELGANLEVRDIRRSTPSHLAALYGQVKALRVLKELGVELSDVIFIWGEEMAWNAVQEGQVEKLKDLKEIGVNLDISLARSAAVNGQVEVLKVLKGLGVNIEVASVAAREGQVEVLKVLKELGANLEAQDRYGETPAHFAAEHGQVEALRELKALGVNLEVRDRYGETPAHRAARKGKVEALRVLKELGANLEARDKMGRTPAHLRTILIQEFKSLGVNLNILDHYLNAPEDFFLDWRPFIEASGVGKAARRFHFIAKFGAVVLGISYLYNLIWNRRSSNRLLLGTSLCAGSVVALKTQTGRDLFSRVYMFSTRLLGVNA